jgi:membrane associated rhomboid family serine protease
MDDVVRFIERLFTEAPSYYLSWPAAAMVVGTILGASAPGPAKELAVVPRTARGLVGILTAPFIHWNLSHLGANLPPFLVLGALMLHQGSSRFLEAALIIMVAQGLLLWLFGRRAAHAGMSGVIFGFLGYLLAFAWLTRTQNDLLIALGVIVFYGGMLAGLKPARDGTSWEGHFFGLISGVGAAFIQTSGRF